MKQHFSKRVQAVLLILVLLLSMTSMVFAEGTRGSGYSNPFTDVKAGKYYYDAVLWAVNHEPPIASGLTANTFGVNSTCTRAQMATFLYAAAGKPPVEAVENPFTDVKEGKWYYDAVMWAVQNGVTGGMRPDYFGLNETCTRAQAVTFLYAAAGSPAFEITENPFSDVPNDKWYAKAVLWAYENGVTGGTTPTTFSPNAKCTRAQIVTFLFKATDEYTGFVSKPDEDGAYVRADDDVIYNLNFKDYSSLAQQARNASTLDERTLLFAQAEAALLDTAAVIPTTSRGGSYALTRVAPHTVSSVMWGISNARVENALVTTEPLTTAHYEQIDAKWHELQSTGTFEAWARSYLISQGYTLKDSLDLPYSTSPETWDPVITARSSDYEAIAQTYDGLLAYDTENELQPALATGYTVSADGLTYTFTLRQGVVWTDSQGNKVADLKADDFAAGLQHMLDSGNYTAILAGYSGAWIKNATEYYNKEITDFSQVGIKALDDHTLQYTLDKPVPYFPTMLNYNIFAPLCRSYYSSQGGKFGAEYDAYDPDCLYGTDPEHIAYCGPYLASVDDESHTILFRSNPLYWNKDNITIKTLTWRYNYSGAYDYFRNGLIDTCTLNLMNIDDAREDGMLDGYAYHTALNSTSYWGNLNLDRGTFVLENGACQSPKTEEQKADTATALNNKSFRKALQHAFDKVSYNAVTQGEELAETNLRNMITPPEFVKLSNAVTDKNGHSFPAGTFYGELVQYYCDQLGCQVDCADGLDGWYKPEAAREYLQAARVELGGNVSWPIHIDVVYPVYSDTYHDLAVAYKESIETALGAQNVTVDLIEAQDSNDWYDCVYMFTAGKGANYDFSAFSGWGADYGDPSTYLDTFDHSADGYMLMNLGLY